jgi:hypothetical protein
MRNSAAKIIMTLAALGGSIAYADCTLSTGPCSTDGHGNTFRTERNLGGSYTTYRNGSPFSTTGQTLGGGYREDFRSGGSRTYTDDPFPSLHDKSGYR